MLRTASLAIAVALLFALQRPLVSGLRQGWITDDWYDITAAVLFIGADLFLLAAVVVGRERFCILSLRSLAAVPVVMLLLLPVRCQTGGEIPGLWYAVLCPSPAIAYAATTVPRRAVAYLVVVPGTVVVVNAFLSGFTGPDFFIANVGNTVIGTFYFVVFAAATMGLGRIVDDAETRAREAGVRAQRLRAQAEEVRRFTALVHDNVLTRLSAVAQGIRPERMPDFRLVEAFDGGADVDPAQLVASAGDAVREASPECPVTVLVSEDARPVPADVASPMVLALAEVARNSVKHAAGSRRTCELRVTADGVGFRFADDGPGFDPDDLRPTAVGVRLSVTGRMGSVEGGDAVIRTAPGEGTNIRLSWDRGRAAEAAAARAARTVARRPVEPLPVTLTDPITGVFPLRFLGMSVVFSPTYVVVLAVLFLSMLSANSGVTDPAGLGTLVLVVVALALMVTLEGERPEKIPEKLARWRVWVIVVCLCASVVLGLWQDPVEPRTWLRSWHFVAFSVVASLLVCRGHLWAGLGCTVFGQAAVILLRDTGIAVVDYNTPLRFLTTQVPVAAAVLVFVGFRAFVQRVPATQSRLRESEEAAAAAAATSVSRAENLRVLQQTVGPVFAAVAQSPEITDGLARRAKLTEMELRDMIRSPLLNVPSLRVAVRDARARGVTVLLLDDRSHGAAGGVAEDEVSGVSGVPGMSGVSGVSGLSAREAVDRVLASFLEAVDAAEEGKVTIRLLPAGRRTFATVTDGHGVVRFDESGARV